jgi:hypothetical protein
MARRLRTASTPSSPLASPASPAASLASPRRTLSNSRSLPDATQKALLEILVGEEREAFFARPFQVYDRNPFLFGEKGSAFREKVHKRVKYLEESRKGKKQLFAVKCVELGVELPLAFFASPPAIEFLPSELDLPRSSRGSETMTSRFGPGTVRLTLGDPAWSCFSYQLALSFGSASDERRRQQQRRRRQ